MRAKIVEINEFGAWDEFCSQSSSSSFLHKRSFLSYHKDKFVDASVIVLDESSEIFGVFPAGLAMGSSIDVVSHPGATYGGLILKDGATASSYIKAYERILAVYGEMGFKTLTVKPMPFVFQKKIKFDEIYALHRLGFDRDRVDLSSMVNLERFSIDALSSRRKRDLKKALKSKCEIVEGFDGLDRFMSVLSDNLMSKHGVKPVHSVDDILTLNQSNPGAIKLACVRMDGEIVAGSLIFNTQGGLHAQYIGSSEKGRECCALTKLFVDEMSKAKEAGERWFSFGISTEHGGSVLNESLYGFKSEFGAESCLHEFYKREIQ